MRTCADIYDDTKCITFEEFRTFPEDFVGHIINGDSRAVLPFISDNLIDLVITSPPYFVNKTYENEWTLDKYSQLMHDVFWGCYRVLKPGGYMVVNFGDYFNKDRFYDAEVPSVYPATINYFQWGRDAGFDLQATRIWRKQFSRMGIPFVCNSHPRPVFDYEHIWTFRKPDGTGQEFVNDRKLSQRGVVGESWSAPAGLGKHEAAFPVDLPMWAIDVYSREPNEIVLDPFFGMGTTALAAINKGRQWVGIEKNKDYCDLAMKRIREPKSAPAKKI
jgi:DNA modification methylase